MHPEYLEEKKKYDSQRKLSSEEGGRRGLLKRLTEQGDINNKNNVENTKVGVHKKVLYSFKIWCIYMSLIHWVTLERSSRHYAVNLSPKQMIDMIRQWYPNTTFTGNIIKVQRSFWYTRDFNILAGPMPTVLKSSWNISKGMLVLLIVSTIVFFQWVQQQAQFIGLVMYPLPRKSFLG